MDLSSGVSGISGFSAPPNAAAGPGASFADAPPVDDSGWPSINDSVDIAAAKRPRRPKNSVDDRTDETKGNRVTPLIDKDQIFGEAKKMIEGAQSLVQVEMYELTNPDMVKLLASEVKKGINVQVILDPSPGFDASKESEKKKALKELRAAGVKVLFYPTTGSRGQINHVKLLIVDGKQVLMGGMNWGTHSPYNHDLDLKIEGPAVNYYEDLFAQDWKISRGPKFDRPPKAEPLPDANTPIISATTNYFRSGIERTLHGHIDEAKKSIHVEMFVMSDDETIKKLIAAHKRGVDVKVLLDPNGVRNGWNPNGETFKKLKRAGVPVKWYNVNKESREKLHGKWAVFDGQVAMAGSSNWSFKGLNINREIASFAKDEATTSIMEKQFQLDWETRAVDRKPDVP